MRWRSPRPSSAPARLTCHVLLTFYCPAYPKPFLPILNVPLFLYHLRHRELSQFQYLFVTHRDLRVCWKAIVTRDNLRWIPLTPIFLMPYGRSLHHASPPSHGHETRPMHSLISRSSLTAISGCPPLIIPRLPRRHRPTSTVSPL